MAAVLVFPFAARAQVVKIVWDASGSFERAVVVESGKFAEVCGPLEKGRAVVWSFSGSTPLDFNIHYHLGKDVRYPARQDRVAASQGTVEVASDQDYCWMWENRTAEKSTLDLRLRLR